MTPMIKLIQKRIESANAFTNRPGNKYGNRKYKSYRNSWYEFLGLYFPKLEFPQTKKITVKITRGYSGKRYDFDNFVTGCKPLFDYLVKANYLKDDSDALVTRIYKQVKIMRNAEWTEIEISNGKAVLE